MKSIVTAIILMASFIGSAQVDMSSYKYVVVPKRFNDFKQVNQHKTSTLISHLFTQKGFVTVYDDNLPDELYSDRCMGLYVDLVDSSSMFTTKAVLILSDCDNKEVLITEQGKSKKKDYEEAFKQAITEAFNSFIGLNYSYNVASAKQSDEPVTISFKNDVKTVDESLELRTERDPAIEQKASPEVQSYDDKTPKPSDYKKSKQKAKEMKKQVATPEEQSFENKEPIETNYKKAVSNSQKETNLSNSTLIGVLYAQELPNGFQLVDSTPKIQLKMYKSSMPNVYVASSDDKDGVVYTSDGKWFFEYSENGNIIKEELHIKF